MNATYTILGVLLLPGVVLLIVLPWFLVLTFINFLRETYANRPPSVRGSKG